MVASRHIKREKASLPVDMCHSKMPLLKLPIALVFNRDDYYDELRGEELYERRSSQLQTQLLQLRKEGLIKFRLVRDSNP